LSSSELQKVLSQIERDFPVHLSAIQEAVRQPSISADGRGVAEMASMVADSIRGLGGECEVVATEGYPIVWGQIDTGAPKTLLIYGMYDVQPVLGESWMVSDPFGGEILELPDLGPCLVSRGVQNTKGPLFGFFNALDSFQKAGVHYPVNFRFVIEGEEELGSEHLPDFVARHGDSLKADAALFPFFCQDRTGKPMLYLGVKGIIFFDLLVRGGEWGGPVHHGIHSSNAVWCHSPAWLLLHAIASMLSPDQREILIGGVYDDVTGPDEEGNQLLSKLALTFQPETQLEQNDMLRFKQQLEPVDLLKEYLFKPSLNVDGFITGHVAAGTKTVLPHEARARLDLRLVPQMDPDRTLRLLSDHLRDHDYTQVELDVHHCYPWSRISIDTAPAQAVMATYRALGYESEVWPFLAGSAPFYLFNDLLQTPIVMAGLGHGGASHSPNEYATVGGIELFEKSMALFIDDYARRG